MPDSTPPRWLPLRDAAALLGVDEGTLRHWADQGKVRAFRTPGGHRRFLEEDLRALMTPPPPDVAGALRRRTFRLASQLPARRLRTQPWFAGLDETFRRRARAYGRAVLELVAKAAGGEVEAQAALHKIRTIGHRYARELRQAGLSLSHATEAFCLFRSTLLLRTLQVAPPGEAQLRALRQVNRLLDEVLVTIVRDYEARPEAPGPEAPA